MKLPSRLVLVIVVGAALPAAAFAGEIRVMTRNLYLGADLTPVVGARDLDGFLGAATAALEQIAASDFPQRAQALADEIAEKRPHVVGLQEVFAFTLDGAHGAPPFRDYLADLSAALAARGVSYQAVAAVQNLSLALPIPGLGFVGIRDRDVILVRSDVAASPVPVACPRASLDGCNYQLVASVDSPVGPIAIERGFVAVDATVDGTAFRVANTHLEVRDLGPTNPLSPLVQALQARELLTILHVITPPEIRLVVLGDINSSPTDTVLMIGGFTIVPPYLQLTEAGLRDAWLLRPGMSPGFTCCQLGDLSNKKSLLFERIDVVFSDLPDRVKANVVGNEPRDRTKPSRLWPSDHAGVVVELGFPD